MLSRLDVQEKMEGIIQQVELEASLAPWIKWTPDSSELAQSDAQHLGVSSVANLSQCNRA